VLEPPSETYICGNPPYKGAQTQTDAQKDDLQAIFGSFGKSWRTLDYVAGWFMKSAAYCLATRSMAALVTTNSICQGRNVGALWPHIFNLGLRIAFAHTSFKWTNLASHKAGVTVAVVGMSLDHLSKRRLYTTEGDRTEMRQVPNINAYLVPSVDVIVHKKSRNLDGRANMDFGNMPADGGALLLSRSELDNKAVTETQRALFIKRICGSAEFIRGVERYCLWISDKSLAEAKKVAWIADRIERARANRQQSKDAGTQRLAARPHQFREMKCANNYTVVVPSVSSESRPFLPVGVLRSDSVLTNLAFGLYDAPLWNMALIASRIHLVWIATVCGKMKTDFRYSNTLGWNTFPVPSLTENQKAELTRCAEDILLAREAHFPATIADLYDPEKMPENLRAAHDKNDETLERIYIGRRFKNDTERLEKLFDMYTKITARADADAKKAKKGAV
jgi:hypothetical protein